MKQKIDYSNEIAKLSEILDSENDLLYEFARTRDINIFSKKFLDVARAKNINLGSVII
jgi:hypothetical protein